MLAGQARGEALGRADDVAGRDDAARGDRGGLPAASGVPGQDLGDRGVLEDVHPQPLHHAGQPDGELGRLDAGAVRRVRRLQRPRHLQPFALLVTFHQPHVVRAVSPRAQVGDAGPQPPPLGRVGRDVDQPALVHVGVDALRAGHLDDLVDRPEHGVLQVDHGLPPARPGMPLA